ncbi:MAG: carboxypeptidase-like regulatory domain-containing protein [bacterium]
MRHTRRTLGHILRRTAQAAGLLATLASPALAQSVRGMVLDSASRRPLANAIVIFLDSSGHALSRTLTNDAGQYANVLAPAVHRVQVLRLGYRPRIVALDPSVADRSQFDIVLATIPVLVEGVRVVAAAECPKRADDQAALALMEHARAGLLAIVIAREANPAVLERISYVRTMQETSDRIERQEVYIDSDVNLTKSFQAANTGAEFVRNGFARDSAGHRIVFGPDADILLDDGFINGYCFHIQKADRSREHQVGLGFAAAEHRKGRVEIDGVLWIDTVAKALRDIEFKFVGLNRQLGGPEPGGSVAFREMPNGVVLVDRWHLRLVAQRIDSTYNGSQLNVRQWPFVRETGGEIARASWKDGHTWVNPVGTLKLHLVRRDGTPMKYAIARLEFSDYAGTADANGDLQLSSILPGPYALLVTDTLAATAPITVGARFKFTAVRDSTVSATLAVPTDDFNKDACVKGARSRWTDVRVVTAEGTPATNARWELGHDLQSSARMLLARGKTGGSGVFGFCERLLDESALELLVQQGSNPPESVRRALSGKMTDVLITLPGRP